MTSRKTKRAMALVITMIIMLLLIMLTGALIKTQSGAFALMRVSDRQRDSRMACRSLYDFCLFQLEHNRNWGKGSFSTTDDVAPSRKSDQAAGSLSSRIEIQDVDGNVFSGRLTDENLLFRIEVVNALTTGSGLVTSGGVPVKNEQVVLHIQVGETRGGQFLPLQKATSVLQLAPLFDGTILSRGDIRLDAGEVFFASKDPRRNEMRTDGDADLPGITKGRARFLKYDPNLLKDNGQTAADFDGKGLLYAGGRLKENGTEIDPEDITDAARASGGRLVGSGQKRVDIYNLSADTIPQPEPGDLKHDVVVPPGEFRFDRISADVTVEITETRGKHQFIRTERRTQSIDVCSYFDPPGSEKPLKVMRGEIDKAAYNPNTRIVDVDVRYPDGVDETIPVDIGNQFYLNSQFQETHFDTKSQETIPELGIRSEKHGGHGPVVIDLNSHRLSVAPDTRVRPQSRPKNSKLPPSSFEITVENGQRPTFILGTAKNDVIFEADGDVTVGGGTTDGLGTVISRYGSVTLEPNAEPFEWEYEVDKNGKGSWVPKKNQIDVANSSSYDGLVVYAEKDVNIKNPSAVDWNFRGFVYANGHFNFDVGGQKALFFGTVVSRSKTLEGEPPSLEIKNSSKVGFVYDPEYLKMLTRRLPNDWTRLESVVWNSSAH